MITSFLALVSAAFFSPFLTGFFPVANAAVSDNLSGFAWSPNAGWVSFNCTDSSPACSGTTYGVTVGAPVSGVSTISGYAWSSNLGWISFNAASLASCPSGTCDARLTVANGQVSGWARACSVFVAGCSGAIKTSPTYYLNGQWDGWISLRAVSNYGILANGPSWTGYAWGGGRVSGSISPIVGGNAVPGWISFRGYTTAATPILYGVNAGVLSSAIGPQIISCGSDKSTAGFNEDVTWTVKYDTTAILSPQFEWVSLDAEAFVAPVSGTSEIKQYTTSGVKTALVKVTVPSTGHVYVVDCNGNVVPGQTDPGFPSVSITGIPNYNLDAFGPNAPTPILPDVGLPQAGHTIRFNASNSIGDAYVECHSGSVVAAENCTNAVTTPFNNVIEIIKQVAIPGSQDTPQYIISTTPTINSINIGQSLPVQADWSVPDTVCPAGGANCTLWARVCADHLPTSPTKGVVCDFGDGGYPACLPGYAGSDEDNCSASWSSFTLKAADYPQIDINSAICKPVPRLSQTNKSVTWNISGVTGGTGSYTYDWIFTGGPNPVNNNPTPSVIYSTYGTKTATVTVHSPGVADKIINCSIDLRVQNVEEF